MTTLAKVNKNFKLFKLYFIEIFVNIFGCNVCKFLEDDEMFVI